MWKEIPGFEGRYEVSDTGQIRSIARNVIDAKGHSYAIRERVLKSNKTKNWISHCASKSKQQAFCILCTQIGCRGIPSQPQQASHGQP